MKNRNRIVRIVSALLVIATLFSSMPLTIFAAEGDGASSSESGSGNGSTNTTPAENVNEFPAGQPADEIDFEAEAGGTLEVSDGLTETHRNIISNGDLTLHIEGTLNVTGSITVTGGDLVIVGSGSLNVNGNITVVAGAAEDKGSVTVRSATLTMASSKSSLTANGASITLEGATLRNIGFVGFTDGTQGDKTLALNVFAAKSNTLNLVGTLGANENTNSVVTLVNKQISEESLSYAISTDYRLTFYGVDKEPLNEEGWLTAYRTTVGVDASKVQTVAFTGVLIDGSFVATDSPSTLALPDYQLAGYTNVGWGMTADSASGVMSLGISNIGTVSELWSVQTAKKVVIEFDRGYAPDKFTNDDYATMTQSYRSESFVGAAFRESDPWRFGYDFIGWEILSGDNVRTVSTDELSSFRLAVSDMIDNGDDTYTLKLQAKWSPKSFNISLNITKPELLDDMSSILVKCDCDACAQVGAVSPQAFAAAHSSALEFDINTNTFKFNVSIQYGMTFAEYFEHAGVGGFTLTDSSRTVVFSTWLNTDNLIYANDGSLFALGENGLLGSTLPQDKALSEYILDLQQLRHNFVTVWKSNYQTMTFSNKSQWYDANNELWTIWVNGEDKTAQINGTASVLTDIPVGSEIVFRVPAGSANANAAFSLWSIYDANDTRITVTERKEGAYRLYSFNMPDLSVTAKIASTAKDVMFNMKTSPVSEQKIGDAYGVWTNELLAGLTPRYDMAGTGLGYAPSSELDGIDLADGWSNGAVLYAHMNYFYELPLEHYYYLTTGDADIDQESTVDQGNGTLNQWRGGHRSQIYLQDCHLWATTYYTANATLQTQITAQQEKSAFIGVLDKMANLYYYLADDFGSAGTVKPKDNCYVQNFVGNNNIIGCIGTEVYGQKSTGANGSATEIRIGARIANNQNGLDAQWLPPSGSFYPYEHEIYKDNFGYWTFGATHDHAWSDVNLYLPHKMLSSGQAYNINGFIHVRTISVLSFMGGTLILEDGVPENWGFGSIYSGAEVIVKGDFLKSRSGVSISGSLIVLGDIRVRTLTVNSGASLAANAIEADAINIKGGTVLANVIRNHSVSGSGYAAATENGDNALYTGYTLISPTYIDSTNNATVAYRFMGGNIYLLGYNTAATAGVSPLTDQNNPLHFLANVSAVGDYADIIADLPTKAVELYEQSKLVNAGNECFFLGDSSKNNRTCVFSGANIYSAGNLSLNSALTVSDGIISASVLSSKQDLIISGGTVEAREIGNSGAAKISRVDGTLRFAKTEITGGNIKADRIGALSASIAGDNRGSLTALSVSLTSYTPNTAIQLVHDALVFYSIDTDKFSAQDSESFPLRMTAVYDGTKGTLDAQAWSLTEPTQGAGFAALTYKDGYNGTGEVKWSLSAQDPSFVTGFNENGELLNNGIVVASIIAADGVTLYAIEIKSQHLSVFQDGNYISQIKVNNEEITVINGNGNYNILASATVAMTVDASMRDKIILAYRDANDIMHNLFPTVSDNGTELFFAMPFMDCELHIVKRFTLYLDEHTVVLTQQDDQQGFRTELGKENADRAFAYSGELYITRNDGKSTLLANKLIFEDNYDNSMSEKVILHDLVLKMETGSATDVTLYIDGTGGKTVYFPGGERTNWFDGRLTFRGLNGNTVDVFRSDSYTFCGKMELFAFDGLYLKTGTLIYPNKVNNVSGYLRQASFTDCKLDISGVILYNSGGAADFNNCEINLLGSSGTLTNCNASLTLTDCTVNGDAVKGTSDNSNSRGSITLNNTVCMPSAPTEDTLNIAASIIDIVLKDGSIFNSRYSLKVKNLTVDESSVLRVGYSSDSGESQGRLSVLNLSVKDRSAVYAAYVICSGHDGTEKDYSYTSRWDTPINGASHDGIIVDGGSVYASEFIGGDYNGKITLLSGYMEAKYIGTYGGYLNGGVINTVRPLIYTPSGMIQRAEVKILGGTVRILGGNARAMGIGYLGGGDSDVTVTDATVIGASIIGRNITLSGADLGINVARIEADTLTIRGAIRPYVENIYPSAENPTVAVMISELMRARVIVIDEGSLVYAEIVEANAEDGERGSFSVGKNDGSALYTDSFGNTGTGEVVIDYLIKETDGIPQNIYGLSITLIIYDYDIPEGDDDPIVTEAQTYYYTYEQGGILVLETPSRGIYYIFGGWLDIDENKIIEEIYKDVVDDDGVKRLKAIWKPVEVVFTVTVNAGTTGMTDEAFEKQAQYAQQNGLGTYDSASRTFSFNETVTVPYKGILFGQGGAFKLGDYRFDSYTFKEIKWQNSPLPFDRVTLVDKAMIDIVNANGGKATLVLDNAEKTSVILSFYLNQLNGKPLDAKFIIGHIGDVVTLNLEADISFAQAIKELEIDDILAIAEAFGYKLIGWSSTPNGAAELDIDANIDTAFKRTWYAVWKAKTYTVSFDAVTPSTDASGKEDGTYYISPTEPSAQGGTTVQGGAGADLTESREFTYDAVNAGAPTVWKEGAQFDKWFYLDAAGQRVYIDISRVFCKESFANESFFNSPEIVIYAEYRDNRIEYHLNGGTWKSEEKENEASGELLKGYTDKNGNIHSTTAAQYTQNGNKHDEQDYRHTLYRTGYTFLGWYDSTAESANKVDAPARFADLELYARWQANSYNVVLYPYATGMNHEDRDDGGARFYETDETTHTVIRELNATTDKVVLENVTVGEHINGQTLPDWQSRDKWGTLSYDASASDVAARLLWGFTYIPMDPLYPDHSGYGAYIDNIKNLYNMHQLFVKNESNSGGSVFELPNELYYKNAIGDTLTQDYLDRGYLNFDDLPAGSTVNMYATYREFALMFVQYYLDNEGNPTEVLLKAEPFTEDLNDLDTAEPQNYTEIEGYSLVGWYINSETVDPAKKYEPASMKDPTYYAERQQEAKARGTHDIVVYGIFAPYTQRDWGLQASTDPLNTLPNDYSFAIPMNMQPGVLTYTVLDGAGLNIVEPSVLEAYETHFDAYTSNNTVSLILQVTHADGTVEEHNITKLGESTGISVSGGDTVKILLKHSNVITQTGIYKLNFKFGFQVGGSEIAGQTIELQNGQVTLNPSVWNVSFDADTDSIDSPVITDTGSFSDGDIITAKIGLNELMSRVTLPKIEGYSPVPFFVNGANVYQNGELTLQGLSENSNGAFTALVAWETLSYLFNATQAVTDKWSISGAESGQNVPYRTEITFTPKGTQEAAFVSFTYGGSTYRLDLTGSNNGNGSYTWSMPAADTAADFKNYIDLYLEKDSIEIFNDGAVRYSYLADEGITWPGIFNIYMNESHTAQSPTDNILTFNGNLSGVTLNLDDLYIGSANGILLGEGAEARLLLNGSTLDVKNIFVSNGARLTLTGSAGARLLLSPASGTAAIGNQDDGMGSSITLESLAVTVNETNGYRGTWFGGENMSTVKLSDISLTRTEQNVNGGRMITNADYVYIIGSTIGAVGAPVSEPIYADALLSIKQSEIYQNIGLPLGNISPIGTGAGGSIEVDNGVADSFSHISVAYTGGGSADAPYTGSMKIYSAKSYVCIGNVLIIELANGDAVIGTDSVVQGGNPTSHAGNYMLIEVLLAQDAAKPNLTVNGSTTVTLNTADFVLGQLNVDSDVTFILHCDLDVDKIIIAEDILLTLRSDLQTVTMADKALEGSLGKYSQIEGTLESSGELGGRNVDISLEEVTVNAGSLYAKNLALTDCSVTCSGNVGSYGVTDGMTTVTLSGITSITAVKPDNTYAYVGALGELGTTFTKLVTDGSEVTVKGLLVRDIFRIKYESLKNGYTLAENSDTVLRTTEEYNGAAVSDPQDGGLSLKAPDSSMTSRFVTWYILNAQGQKISLIPEAAISPATSAKDFAIFRDQGLLASDIDISELIDGIPTVRVYAFYSISGTVQLTEGEQYVVFTGSNNLSFASDKGYSALFTVDATREDGEDYALMLDKALPKGTKLILVWLQRADNKPMYYYYNVAGNETTVMFSDFTAMGKRSDDPNNKLQLGSSDNQSESFIITVDHTGVDILADLNYKVGFGFGYRSDPDSDVEQLCAKDITVVAAADTAEVIVTDGTVSIETPNNPYYTEKEYGYAILVKVDRTDNVASNKDLPYTARPMLETATGSYTVTGELIGGDMILFKLGAYEGHQGSGNTEFILSEMPEGYNYIWSVVLLDSPTQVNVLKTLSKSPS